MTGEFNFFNHPALQPEGNPSPERELIRVIVFGPRDAVRATIHKSHVRGFWTIDIATAKAVATYQIYVRLNTIIGWSSDKIIRYRQTILYWVLLHTRFMQGVVLT